MMNPSTDRGENFMPLLELSKNTFQNQTKEGLTLVDFWAPWCGPCKIQLQILEKLSKEIKDQTTIAKVNVDKEAELASQFEVMSIPTLLLFKDGELIEKMVGVQSKELLLRKMSS